MDPRAQDPVRWPLFLTTILGSGFIIFGSLILSIVAILTAWIPPRGRAVQYWARCWARGLLFCAGVRVSVEIQTPLEKDTAYVFMSNHQSLFDIPVLLATLPVPALFMAKRELFMIPLFGWAMRSGGFIPVNRSNPSRARESFREAIQSIEKGSSILLFPEETRSHDGELLPFKRGGFLLARKGKAKIVPVGLHGTLAVQSRSSYLIRASHVVVSYGSPVDLTNNDSREDNSPEGIRNYVARLAQVGTTR